MYKKKSEIKSWLDAYDECKRKRKDAKYKCQNNSVDKGKDPKRCSSKVSGVYDRCMYSYGYPTEPTRKEIEEVEFKSWEEIEEAEFASWENDMLSYGAHRI